MAATVAVLVFGLAAANIAAAELWVAPDGSDESGDGSFDNPYGSIGIAVRSSAAGDTITLKPGIYECSDEVISLYNRVYLRSQYGPDSTTLSGADKNGVFLLDKKSAGCVIDGFNIVSARPAISAGDTKSLTVKNNRFEKCISESSGGAIYMIGSRADIFNNEFINDSSALSGGAIALVSSTADIYDNLFSGNRAANNGGAIYADGCNVNCYNNIFINNSATDPFYSHGGAIYMFGNHGESPYWVVQNNIFRGNRAQLGGGIAVAAFSSYIYNNLFYRNVAHNFGAGIFVEYNFDPYIYNNIFQNNNPDGMGLNDSPITHYNSNNYYNNTPYNGCSGCPPDSNDYYLDPDLADVFGGDYRLTDASGMINRGKTDLPNLLSFDFKGQDRSIAGAADIGPDEYADCTMSGDLVALSDTAGCAGLSISFTALNLKGYYDSLIWDFGDGGEAYNVLNPSHVYEDTGTFTVSLHMVTPCTTVVINRQNYIHIMSQPVPEFQADATRGCVPFTVNFENLTRGKGEQYLWNFGDATSSTDVNPAHTYETPGVYTVELMATNSCGEARVVKTGYINALMGVAADLSAGPRQGSAPLSVDFFDRSLYSPITWFWDFGDGFTALEQNPRHRYLTPGRFDVSLMCMNECADVPDTTTEIDYITVFGFTSGVYDIQFDKFNYRYDFFVDSLFGLFDRPVSFSASLPVAPSRGRARVSFGDSTANLFDSTFLSVSMTKDLPRGNYEVLLITTGSGGIPADTQTLQFSSQADSMIETTPLALDFGEVPEDSSRTLNLTVKSNVVFPDTFSLTVSDISVSPSVYNVGFPGSFVLDAVSRSRQIPVSFTPDAPGPVEGVLTIISDDPAYPQWTVALTGTGITERTPPVVDSTSPYSNEKEYAVTDSVTVYFSEPLDQESLKPGAVTITSLKTGATILGAIKYNAEKNLLSFQPEDGFGISDSIRIVLDGGIADLAGNTLDGDGDGTAEGSPLDDFILDFTTGLAVFPGDANNDGVVNEMDVLPIGVYWGISGETRRGNPDLWTRQAAKSWIPARAAYADCNGDGVVDGNDLAQVENYWGMSHEIEGAPIAFTVDELNEKAGNFERLNAYLQQMSLGARAEKIHGILEAYLAGQSNIENFTLGRNFPNPFNPITTIDFSIPRECHVTLEVYNVLGQTVKMLVDENLPQGYHSVTWDATDRNGNPVPTGVYFYRITADEFHMVRKMLLIR